MSRKPFTKEEIDILLQNPYTRKVTPYTISFTVEFKQHFIKEYNAGKTARQIFSSHGYDIRILGDRRIWSIPRAICVQENNSVDQCSERSKNINSSTKNLLEAEVKQLRQEVAYLRQENEFLKKITAIKITKE